MVLCIPCIPSSFATQISLMAQSMPTQEPLSTPNTATGLQGFLRRLFGRANGSSKAPSVPPPKPEPPKPVPPPHKDDKDESPKDGLMRRVSRKVVPGIPRAQTFKRQQSELRSNLEPVTPTPAERRTISAETRLHASRAASQTSPSLPRSSAPDLGNQLTPAAPPVLFAPSVPSRPASPVAEEKGGPDVADPPGTPGCAPDSKMDQDSNMLRQSDAASVASTADARSTTTSQLENLILELEQYWILNLSMHFRDKSKREKFFVTYRQDPHVWRRVTISLDYRHAPEGSLEWELAQTESQREKNAKIYETIRDSLGDIQFYDTVTNLKLQTTDGRLHVHVVEDVNEIIRYPGVHMIQHMDCDRVMEKDIEFDAHMSGFVYRVKVKGEVLIKKEIPGPDTVEEFLYEINALNQLKHSNNVIRFHGVVVDDEEENVRGLLISYAEMGALNDVIYDGHHDLSWPRREKWAKQIIHGLSEIHELGFVQGDFTLSNIVIDGDDNAKIIDINRRGCPVGWEPPEATPLIESNQRISMYIGVKSDLYQLGMVLWALAAQDDEPEARNHQPLRLDSPERFPAWYRKIVDICLNRDPRMRLQALQLLTLIPGFELHDPLRPESHYSRDAPPMSTDDDDEPSRHDSLVGTRDPPAYTWTQPINPPPTDWPYGGWGSSRLGPLTGMTTGDLYPYPARGRSPPSPISSSHGGFNQPRYGRPWSAADGDTRTTTSAENADPEWPIGYRRSGASRTSRDSILAAKTGAKPELGGVPNSIHTSNHVVEPVKGADLELQRSAMGHDQVATTDSGRTVSQNPDTSKTPTRELVDPIGNFAGEAIKPAGQANFVSDHNITVSLRPPQQEAGTTEPVHQIPNINKELLSSRSGRPPVESPPSPPPSREEPTKPTQLKLDRQILAELEMAASEGAARAADSREDHAARMSLGDGPNQGRTTRPPRDKKTSAVGIPSSQPLNIPTTLGHPQPPFSGVGMLDSLAGVGSAYDYTSESRQGSIDNDDLGMAISNAETFYAGPTLSESCYNND